MKARKVSAVSRPLDFLASPGMVGDWMPFPAFAVYPSQAKKSNVELQADVVDYLKKRLQMGKGPVRRDKRALPCYLLGHARCFGGGGGGLSPFPCCQASAGSKRLWVSRLQQCLES